MQLSVVIGCDERVATFLKPMFVIRNHGSVGVGVIVHPLWVVVVQQPASSHVFLIVWVLLHHEELVVSGVRTAVHAAQVNRVLDVCPKVGPLVKVLKIGEAAAAVGVGVGGWDTVGFYIVCDVWRWRRGRW